MPKYKIRYNVGYGREEEEIEARSADEANEAAYEAFSEALLVSAQSWRPSRARQSC